MTGPPWRPLIHVNSAPLDDSKAGRPKLFSGMGLDCCASKKWLGELNQFDLRPMQSERGKKGENRVIGNILLWRAIVTLSPGRKRAILEMYREGGEGMGKR